ncbi:MAG: putative phosphatase/phosphohexomutase [Parcubacteria group bacterium Gr01-1014_91]|nr:MAG: putative phosphatase/phosphohexomutase [Parcubacteria group bacterium Gr01-1014_91]
MRHIEKILFDLDGTLFNTQGIHAEIESSLLAQSGIILSPEEITRRYAGTHTRKYFAALLGSTEMAENLLSNKRDLLMQRKSEIMPLYTENFFEQLRGRGYKMAIGTGASHRTADFILDQFGIAHFFDQIVCSDDVSEGKPHPETWERAANGVAPQTCLVIEDGLAGVEAALAAGMSSALLLPREHSSATPITSLEELLTIL